MGVFIHSASSDICELHNFVSAVMCDTPAAIAQASMSYTNTTFGSVTYYTCGRGYRMTRTSDTLNVTCDGNRQWQPDPLQHSCSSKYESVSRNRRNLYENVMMRLFSLRNYDVPSFT